MKNANNLTVFGKREFLEINSFKFIYSLFVTEGAQNFQISVSFCVNLNQFTNLLFTEQT